MALRSHRRDNDRGAILVHVALSLLAMMAFVAFTLDYGVMWASRAQAQNSADAGALAGAVALVFDNPSDFTSSGPAKLNAFEATQRNVVWGNSPTVDIETDITFPTCPTDVGGGTCIRVDVHRTQVTGNPLPMFFGQLFGRVTQDIRASATAQVSGANSARCMLPFLLADRWADYVDPTPETTVFANDGDHTGGTLQDAIDGWSNNDLYENDASAPDDLYIAPYNAGHTGWTTDTDYGRQLVLHEPVGKFSAGWAGIADLPNLGTGAEVYRQALYDCDFNSAYVAIAAEDHDCQDPGNGYPNSGTTEQMGLDGCIGIKTGWVAEPTDHGVTGGGPVPGGDALIEQDPTAVWRSTGVNFGPDGQEGGVVPAPGSIVNNMDSPRIRPVPVFDITEYMVNGCTGTGCIAKVVNIVGFFVEGLCRDVEAAGGLDDGNQCDPDSDDRYQVVGRIVTLPGDLVGAGAPVEESSFLKTVRLVR